MTVGTVHCFRSLEDCRFYATTWVLFWVNIMDKSSFTPFQLLMDATQHGNVEEVARLIPLCPSTSLNNMVLWMAVSHGHNQCIELLIPVADPLDNKSAALKVAAGQGNAQGVRLLLPVSNPRDNSAALIAAASNGHVECVNILLPVSDPLAHNSLALLSAAKNGHHTCVDVLAPVSNVEEVYSTLNRAQSSEQRLLSYMEEKVWDVQRLRLQENIDGCLSAATKPVRKL